MLTVTIPKMELFNDVTQKFIYTEEITLTLEHSLVSLSKWEQKWEKPFLDNQVKTTDETLDYIRCMTVSPEFPPENCYNGLSNEQMQMIGDYIDQKMTATWFKEVPGQAKATSSEMVTSEIIYYWLVALQIDFQVQYWHLNRLLTLVKVINIKNDPKKKLMPKREAAAQQRSLNAQRKAKFGTKG